MSTPAQSQALPPYARVNRDLPRGVHRYADLLPLAIQSPAMRRIESSRHPHVQLVDGARVRIQGGRGFAWVDIDVPCIVLTDFYYRRGAALDLYLDLLHELTHMRQLAEGLDLWDEGTPYVDRITEIEGYAVAVEEGRRLGMSDEQVIRHLSNPWMTAGDVKRLIGNVHRFLNGASKDVR